MMNSRAKTLAVAALGLVFLSCASSLQGPPPLTQQRDLEAFKEITSYPNAEAAVALVTAGQFMAAHRDYDGYRYFTQLANLHPERPLFRSLRGMMQARTANDVALLSRVAWVNDAIKELDAGAQGDPVLGRYIRGLVFSDLPERFGKARDAVSDLKFALEKRDQFPFDPERGIHRALVSAYRMLGDTQSAQADSERAGVSGDEPRILANLSVDAREGFRFTEPRLRREADGVYVAEGFDMSNIAFLVDDTGVIAIDAGTTEDSARAAVAALRKITQAPIKYVVITHAHWDHVGGLAALRESGTVVIADATFPQELERVRAFKAPYGWFFGTHAANLEIKPDRLVGAEETLTLGKIRISLIPAPSGETRGCLFIADPTSGLLFVGDAFMPYVGSPFAPDEGSADGYLKAIAEVRRIAPKRLIHGHPPLTRYFTMEAMPGLEAGLTAARAHAIHAMQGARALPDVLHDNFIPPAIKAAPAAAQPYLVMRDHFIEQLYRAHGARWSAAGEGMNHFTRSEWANVFELLADGDVGRVRRVVEELLDRGDTSMAYELVEATLARHPENASLKASRRRTLTQLREQYQLIDPFRFIVHSEQGGTPLPPIQPAR
jgi:glyoxylase-like metal-dependent hydrolase (beta-lactamase superfamily II)